MEGDKLVRKRVKIQVKHDLKVYRLIETIDSDNKDKEKVKKPKDQPSNPKPQ